MTIVGSGIPSLAAPAGAVAGPMGAMVLGLLLATALVIALAHRRRAA
jgi:hypothetical protein